MFGPFRNGVQYAGISLHRFLREVHANWSTESRENLQDGQRELIEETMFTFHDTLLEAEVDYDTLCRLRRLGVYLPVLKNIDKTYGTVIEGLRTALPFHDTYMREGQTLRLSNLRNDLPQWAAITALYELLLRTDYWDERGEEKIDRPYDVRELGLLDGYALKRADVQEQLDAFRAELKARNESKFAFHPLDVMARLFNPDYFERLLELGLVELTPANVARQAF
jgi:hypothetical protein